MKKYLGITAIIAITILLTWCGKQANTTEENDTDRQEMTNSDVSDCKRWCDLLVNKNMNKDDCYNLCETSKKLESNNIRDCDDIEKTSGWLITKDTCIQSKASQTKNPEFCSEIENQLNKDACYMALADEVEDPSLCEKIGNEIIKTTCVQENTEE